MIDGVYHQEAVCFVFFCPKYEIDFSIIYKNILVIL